ncbi:MAG: hypothetical protein KDK65_02765, partial [Chlamydiia bacterium]|nr:hypothetical protein [Chlamydiia bacterium]
MSVNINFTANDVSLIEGNQGARAQFIYQGKTYTLVQHYDISVTKDQAFRAMQKNIGTMLNLAEVSQLGVKTEKILVDHHDTFRRWKRGEVKECKVAQYLAKKGRPVVPIPHPRHVTDTSMLSATKIRRIERMHAKRDVTSVLSGVGNRFRSIITT